MLYFYSFLVLGYFLDRLYYHLDRHLFLGSFPAIICAWKGVGRSAEYMCQNVGRLLVSELSDR